MMLWKIDGELNSIKNDKWLERSYYHQTANMASEFQLGFMHGVSV